MPEPTTFTCARCGATAEGTWRGDPDCGDPGCMVAHGIPVAPDGWSAYDPGPDVEGFAWVCPGCKEKTDA